MEMENKKNPPPGKSINKKPEQEPNTSPSTGHHKPDIQDEKLKRKHGNRPQERDEINPGEIRDGNPEEYNDGAPVEEKSPRVSNSL
jgi:hypothetical protein